MKRKGLDLLGVLPHEQLLSNPTVDLIREELRAELLNQPPTLDTLVEDVVVGAMGAQNAMQFFKRGTLLITPGDREDILLAAGATTVPQSEEKMAGIVLTGGLRPSESVLKALANTADSRAAGEGRQLSSRLQGPQSHRQDPPDGRQKNRAHPRHRREAHQRQKDY